jgi:hypothetical protein
VFQPEVELPQRHLNGQFPFRESELSHGNNEQTGASGTGVNAQL